ncbi:MAG: efflux RND transporter permease subunit [Pseudomonadota bacterium]
MQSLSTLLFRNTRLTVLTLGMIAVVGITAFGSLERQEDPKLTNRFGTILTYYPGATADRIETLITEKIEAELQEIYELDEIDSFSRAGISQVGVNIGEDFDDVDAIWSRVRDRLADAATRMPAGATAPELLDQRVGANTLIAALTWDRKDAAQIGLMSRLAEELEERLRQIPGTEATQIHGEADEEVRVTVDPQYLAQLRLSVSDVSNAILLADAKVSAGELHGAGNSLIVEVAGELNSLARVRRIPLKQLPDGQTLRIGDVASIEKTVVTPAATMALMDGQRGIAIAAKMDAGRRVDVWVDWAKDEVEKFRSQIPRGIKLEVIFDQSIYTSERLNDLMANLAIAALIVVAVLFFMMGWRSALIVGAALPLTLAMVLGFFKLNGVPLHQISVTGLIIALGLLIDNAIVVVDEYHLYRRNGASRIDSIAGSVHHLFIPLLASTTTTVLAFMPIALSPGGVGEFVGTMAWGVILAVVCSFALAMTVIPTLAAMTDPNGEKRAPNRRWWRDGYSNERLLAVYRRSLDTIIKRPWIGVAGAMTLPVIGFGLAFTLMPQFFPPVDRDQFQIQMNLPAQASIEETWDTVNQVHEMLVAHPDIESSYWFLGEGAPRVFYNAFADNDGVSSYAGAFVNTVSAEATRRILPELQQQFMDAFPQASITMLPYEQGPPFAAPIEVRLMGPNLEVLKTLGEEVRGILAQTEHVTYTNAQLSGGEAKFIIQPDEEAARLAGLSLVDIAGQLNANLSGQTGGSILESTEELPIRVRVADSLRGDTGRVSSNVLTSSSVLGADEYAGIPLNALSTTTLAPEISGIAHWDGERVNAIHGFLTPFVLPQAALDDFRARLEASDFKVPDGYKLEFGGESEERAESLSNLFSLVGPLIIMMAGTIILSFNSFRMAGVIGLVGFLSIGLAMLSLAIFGHNMGMMGIVGAMGLLGLSINGSIVVLSALRANTKACEGDPDATREAIVDASRHIVSTTFTTIGGFMPLIIWGDSFWPPLATAIAGGVGGSAILALYLTPALFVVIIRSKLKNQKTDAEEPEKLPSGNAIYPVNASGHA